MLKRYQKVTFIMRPTTDRMPVNVKRNRGIVIDCEPKEAAQPGNIPDFAVRIRGESGREVTVSMVENYVRKA